jgi:hypothetical protein
MHSAITELDAKKNQTDFKEDKLRLSSLLVKIHGTVPCDDLPGHDDVRIISISPPLPPQVDF